MPNREIGDVKKILVKTRFLAPTLIKSERRAADLLLEQPHLVMNMTLAQFAAAAQCGQATVVRFCRRLGMAGFSELKTQLAGELGDLPQAAYSDIKPGDGFTTIMRKVFNATIHTLQDTLVLNADSDGVLSALVKAERIALFGLGDAAIPCRLAYIKFLRLGIPCFMDLDADVQLITASLLRPGDVALVISHSGRSKTIVEAARLAKAGGAITVCITKHQRSPLVDTCDYHLFTATSDLTVGKEIIARRVAEQAILESLYLGVLMRKGPALLENLKNTSAAVAANKID